MNEIIFFIHVLLIVGFVWGALRLGAGALVALVALMAVLANALVVKQIELFGMAVTCSDVFAVGSIVGLNLLQEYFGREEARRAVRVSFWGLLFFFVMVQVHLGYQPAGWDRTQEAFKEIFSQTFRIVAASMGVYWVVQRCDVALFGWLKRVMGEGRLGLRMGLAIGATQLLDTALFSVVGLYGIVESVWDVMVMSYAVKCVCIGAMAAAAKWMRRDVLQV